MGGVGHAFQSTAQGFRTGGDEEVPAEIKEDEEKKDAFLGAILGAGEGAISGVLEGAGHIVTTVGNGAAHAVQGVGTGVGHAFQSTAQGFRTGGDEEVPAEIKEDEEKKDAFLGAILGAGEG